MPSNASVKKAFIWWTASSDIIDSTCKITKNGIALDMNAKLLGTGPDKCWQKRYTLNFRLDVTDIINTNGNYDLNIGLGSGPFDGIGLVIIYSDSTANFVGGLSIMDGIFVRGEGVNNFDYKNNLNIEVPCINTFKAEQLFLVGDIQFTATIGNDSVTKSIAPNWFNFDTIGINLMAGVNTQKFNINTSGDCYSVVGLGLCYQYPLDTIVYSNLRIISDCSTQRSHISFNSNKPLNVTWYTNPIQYGDTANNVPPGKYIIKLSDSCGNSVYDSIRVELIKVDTNSRFYLSATDTLVCNGDSVSVDLSVLASNFGFNTNQLPAGWSVAGGASFGSNICGNSPNGSSYYWSSTSAGTPMIMTPDMNICDSGSIRFLIKYAEQGGSSPCEGPDQNDEGVSLEYSTNGGLTWTEFVYYNPLGMIQTQNPLFDNYNYAYGPTLFTSWNYYNVSIPPNAVTSATRFRWIQKRSSGSCCDNWGLDDISITGNQCDSNVIVWNNVYSNLNQIKFKVDKDTCFIVQAKNRCDAAIFTDTICIKLNPPTLGTETRFICAGDSFMFNGIYYSSSNNFATDILVNQFGCDSIVTLNLTVRPTI